MVPPIPKFPATDASGLAAAVGVLFVVCAAVAMLWGAAATPPPPAPDGWPPPGDVVEALPVQATPVVAESATTPTVAVDPSPVTATL